MEQEKILSKLEECLWCEHSREFHLTDKHGYNYCETCRCHTFVEDLHHLRKNLVSKLMKIYI
jgi:hypothetical protein